jgi:predicted  nucleic acid-binding Zn-ribbon protein
MDNNPLECPVCLERYGSGKNPMNTNCGHTFCQSCIMQLHSCPNCRGNITAYEVNYALMTVVDMTNAANNAAANINTMRAANINTMRANNAAANADVASAMRANANATAMRANATAMANDSASAMTNDSAPAMTNEIARSPYYSRINLPSAEDEERCKIEIARCFGRGYFDGLSNELKELLITNMWHQLSVRSFHLDENRITIGGAPYTGGSRPVYGRFSSTGVTLERAKSPLELFMEFVTSGNSYSSSNIVPIPTAIEGLRTDRTFAQLAILCTKYMSYNFRTNEFMIDSRLAKFIKILLDIDYFKEAIGMCQRPNFWTKTMEWLDYIANASMQLGILSWEGATNNQKNTLRLIALIGPSAEFCGTVAIIRGFETGESLINFSGNARDVRAIASMMDAISNPETYQVSQVAQALLNHNVSLNGRKLYISLEWKTLDDLDLGLRLPNGRIIDFRTMLANDIELNFDANQNCTRSPTTTPVEFISSRVGTTPLFGRYTVLVNCYKFKYSRVSIPFTLTITVGGVSNTYSYSWNGVAGSAVNGGTCYQQFTIGPEDFIEQSMGPIISDSGARSIKANTSKFIEHYGSNPSSNIVDLSNAPREVERLWIYNLEANCGITGGGRALISSLIGAAGKARTTLSERLAPKPFVEYFANLPESADIRIQLAQCSGLPAYATQITRDLESRPLGAFNFNVLHDATAQIFLQPNTTIPNTGRLSYEWIRGCASETYEIKIIAIVKWNDNYFCIVDKAKFPDRLPVTGGFYPSDLTLDQHSIRAEYSIFNTVRPLVPTSSSSIPMIGFWIHRWHTSNGIFSIKINGEVVRLQL